MSVALRRRRAVAAAALLGALGLGAPEALAGTEFSQRGRNRSEGILSATNVSGDVIELVAVHLEPVRPPAADAELVYLMVPRLPSGPTRVLVREPDLNYLMEPVLGTGGSGDGCDAPMRPGRFFCWPTADVIRPAGIDPVRLRVDAQGAAGRLRVPGLLSGVPEAPQSVRFAFHLETRAPLDGAWAIARERDGRLELLSKDALHWKGRGPLTLHWKPAPDDVRDATEELHFVFRGVVQTKPPRNHRLDIPFLAIRADALSRLDP